MAVEIDVGADLVAAFARLTGDRSSIHVDPQFARKTRFREPIVHGMLPVLLLVGRLCFEERAGRRAGLRAISCRFTSGLRIGERIRLDAEPQVDGEVETWAFAITRAADGAKVTTGKAVLSREPEPEPVEVAGQGADSLPLARIEEKCRTLPDLAVGATEEVAFRAEPGAVRGLLHLLDDQVGPSLNPDGFDDAAATAVSIASTLIGMRLPGRYATFLDLEATFPRPVARGAEVLLRGTVAEIARTGSRMRVGLEWIQDAAVVGHGTAFTMIGAAPATALSCAAIRAGYSAAGVAGRVALITGASRGIGEAAAKLLAMNGAHVIVHYFRGRADADAIVDDIRKNGGQALALRADLADRASVAALFAAAQIGIGPVDILVNNAVGEFTPKAFEALLPADYLSELNISLFGMHACCQQALPHMREQRWGKIVNMGTVATEMPIASQTRYITVKSAVVGHTRSLAVETAADNIQVNMVVPSMTETSLIACLPRVLIDRLADESPGGSLLQPIDVAKTILFLASDWSNAISGQQIMLTRGAPPFG